VLARVLRQAKKDFAEEEAAWPEDEYEKGQRESLQRPLGLELPPTARRRRVAVAHGFSLQADTAVDGNDRWDEEVVLSGRHTAGWTQSTLQGENDHE
jgi:hypothetical protein